MSRTDPQLEAMLRHLRAVYYKSLYGGAEPCDVTGILDAIEDYLQVRQDAGLADDALAVPAVPGPATSEETEQSALVRAI